MKERAVLNVEFLKDTEVYSDIIFKLCANGSPKEYHGKDAENMILTLISSNEEFDYYNKE